MKTKVVVIGAGSAGLSAANSLTRETEDFVVIDQGPLGTTCARVGCMPSKSLIQPAHVLGELHHWRDVFEVDVIIREKDLLRHVRMLRDYFVEATLTSAEPLLEKHLIKGRARILSENLVEVNGQKIETDAIIVATGSEAFVPEEWRKELGDALITSENFFELEDLSGDWGVIGTGAIGIELGQALAHLKKKVTVISHRKGMAGLSDEDVIDSAVAAFSRELEVCFAPIKSLKCGKKITVETDTFEFKFDRLLVAAGRRARLAGLGLEEIGFSIERGALDYDPETCRLGESKIFLAGDVSGFEAVLHVASASGRIAAHNALHVNDQKEFTRAPRLIVTFTEPQIAAVGQGRKALEKAGIDFLVGEIDFTNQGRARTMRQNIGLMRLYADRKGYLLGAEMCGPRAEHMAHFLTACIVWKKTVPEMLDLPYYHPVLEEGLRTALRTLARQL